MKTGQLTLVDEKAIQDKTKGVDGIVNHLNTAKQLHEDFFGDFVLSEFTENLKGKPQRGQLIEKWIDKQNIDFRGLKKDSAIKLGLVDAPEPDKLIDFLQSLKIRIISQYPKTVWENIETLFCPVLGRFATAQENESHIYQSIKADHTTTAQTPAEISFIEDLETFARIWERFAFVHGIRPNTDQPKNLFFIPENHTPGNEIKLNHLALKKFRELKANTQ
jgi:hypothetical protein